MLRFLIIVCLFVQEGFAASFDTARLDQQTSGPLPFLYLPETIELEQLEDVRRRKNELAWRSAESFLNMGVSEKAHWIKLTLRNDADSPRSLILTSEDLKTDYVDAYALRGEVLLWEAHTGDHRPYRSRLYDYSGFAFPLQLGAGEEVEVYLRLLSTAPLELDFRYYTVAAFEKRASTLMQLEALYVGAMGAIILFNFLLYFSSRENIYLLYCLFQACSMLSLAIALGNGYGYLWPESPLLNTKMVIVLPSFTLALALTFALQYLGLRVRMPRSSRLMAATALFLCGMGIAGAFTDRAWVVYGLYFAMLLTCFWVLLLPGWLAWKGDRFARLFLGAWVPLALGSLVFVLGRLDIVFSPLPQGYEMAFGSVWEAVFLSLCLGDRFMQMKKQEISYLLRIQEEERAAHEAKLHAESQSRERYASEREALANRNLVKVICHDLANPLSVIINYAQILRRMQLSPGETEVALQKIHASALHQQEIITHVREFEALNSSKKEVVLQPVPLLTALQLVSDFLHKNLDDRQMKFVLPEVAPDLHVMAEQKSLVYNVFANLLSNAIKFSADRSDIRCRIEEVGEWIEISFEDSGIGMDEELLARIFDFSQATSRKGLRGERGTGFGLPLVKTYVEKYGGVLTVTSRTRDDFPESHGSCFILKLKRARAVQDSAA